MGESSVTIATHKSYAYRVHVNIDFSNVLTKDVIERLAEVDEYEVVKEVQVRVYLHLGLLATDVDIRNISLTTHPSCLHYFL